MSMIITFTKKRRRRYFIPRRVTSSGRQMRKFLPRSRLPSLPAVSDAVPTGRTGNEGSSPAAFEVVDEHPEAKADESHPGEEPPLDKRSPEKDFFS
jgi:hypothetical protein